MSKKDYTGKVNTLLSEGYEISVGEIIGESWELLKKNLGMFIIISILALVISGIIGMIPIVGILAGLILGPAFSAGFMECAKLSDEGKTISVSDFFKGFNFLGDVIGPYILSIIFILLGTMLLIIPGIYLAVCYIIVIPYFMFAKQKGIMDDLENVRKVMSKRWFTFFGLIIVLALINLLGVLILGIGLLITYPLTMIAYYVIFKRTFGLPEETSKDDLYTELKTDL